MIKRRCQASSGGHFALPYSYMHPTKLCSGQPQHLWKSTSPGPSPSSPGDPPPSPLPSFSLALLHLLLQFRVHFEEKAGRSGECGECGVKVVRVRRANSDEERIAAINSCFNTPALTPDTISIRQIRTNWSEKHFVCS